MSWLSQALKGRGVAGALLNPIGALSKAVRPRLPAFAQRGPIGALLNPMASIGGGALMGGASGLPAFMKPPLAAVNQLAPAVGPMVSQLAAPNLPVPALGQRIGTPLNSALAAIPGYGPMSGYIPLRRDSRNVSRQPASRLAQSLPAFSAFRGF